VSYDGEGRVERTVQAAETVTRADYAGTTVTQRERYVYGDQTAGEDPDKVYGVRASTAIGAAEPDSTALRLSYAYDGLGRLTGRTVAPLNGTGYGSTTFTYRDGASSNTTTGII